MVARVNTVAFRGIDVVDVDAQVQMATGLPAFTMVGRINRSRNGLASPSESCIILPK